jgi:hypothetical protein
MLLISLMTASGFELDRPLAPAKAYPLCRTFSRQPLSLIPAAMGVGFSDLLAGLPPSRHQL